MPEMKPITPNLNGSVGASTQTGVLAMCRVRLLKNAAVAAVVFYGVGVNASASAQESSPPPLKPQTTTIEVDVIADGTYDSNVARTSAALARARGVTPSDELFQPSVSLNLGRRLGRQTLFLQGSLGYDFYRRNHVLNRERIDLHPGVIIEAGRCAGTLSGHYGRHQSELSDLALVGGVSGFHVVKNTEETKNIDLSATCGRRIGFAPTFDISESWRDNSDLRIKQSDSTSFSVTAGLAYQRPQFGKASLFGNYAHTDYPNRRFVAFGSVLTDGYDVYSGGLSYERHIGSRLDGMASLSYTQLNNKAPGSVGFSGLTYSASGSYQIDPKLLLKLTFSRATLPSSRLGATFSVDKTLSGEFDYNLTSRVVVKVGASHTHRSYPGALGLIGFDLTRETVNSEFGDVIYRLGRRISLGLDVTHTQRDADFTALSYSATRVGVSVRSSF